MSERFEKAKRIAGLLDIYWELLMQMERDRKERKRGFRLCISSTNCVTLCVSLVFLSHFT